MKQIQRQKVGNQAISNEQFDIISVEIFRIQDLEHWKQQNVNIFFPEEMLQFTRKILIANAFTKDMFEPHIAKLRENEYPIYFMRTVNLTMSGVEKDSCE